MSPDVLDATSATLAFVRARPALGVGLVMGLLGVAVAVVRAVQVRRGLAPETTRKAVHVAMSAVVLTLPWLFEGPAPVLALCGLALAAMAAVRWVPALRGSVGGVLHGVERRSYGELYFPLAVCALYLLTADRPVLYVVPILLLGLADPAAALIGVRHGQAPYQAVDGKKSREGSVAFFAVAFLCVHVPLLLFTQVGRAECLLAACIVGALATMLEAMAWRGLDNLFVPLGAYVLLARLLSFDASLLLGHLVVVLVLAAGVTLWRRETTLRGSAVVAAAVVAYVTWAVGGTVWLLAPAMVFFTYTRLWPGLGERDGHVHTVQHVLSVASVGTVWVLAFRALDRPEVYVPYTLAYAGYLALLGVEKLKGAHPGWSCTRVGLSAALRSAVVVVGPFLLVEAARGHVAWARPEGARAALVLGGLGLVSTALAALVLAHFDRWIDHETSEFGGRAARAALIAATSSVGLLAPLLL
jgi:phytol kinase